MSCQKQICKFHDRITNKMPSIYSHIIMIVKFPTLFIVLYHLHKYNKSKPINVSVKFTATFCDKTTENQ